MKIIEEKLVAIKDLPDGCYKERLTELTTNTDVKVQVVAVAGGAPDWTAYCGFPRSFHEMKPEREKAYAYYVRNVSSLAGVMSSGDKFPEDEAKLLFPNIETEWGYRK